MPTVHNLHQPLFGYRPCTASHSLRRHDQRRDRLDSDLLLVPLASDSLIEVSLDPLAPRLARSLALVLRARRRCALIDITTTGIIGRVGAAVAAAAAPLSSRCRARAA